MGGDRRVRFCEDCYWVSMVVLLLSLHRRRLTDQMMRSQSAMLMDAIVPSRAYEVKCRLNIKLRFSELLGGRELLYMQ